MTYLEESRRCLHCKNASCMQGCPAGYNIPQFLQLVAAGQIEQAAQTGHIFGEICSYVCPKDKQCKGHCILGRRGTPIDVSLAERQVFANHFPSIERQSSQLAHLKVAVVGGGVSGMTFAVRCFSQGARVTILERNQLLHTLRSIPSFRLPTQATDRVVNAVLHSGIEVQKAEVNRQTLQRLMQQFDVVYLATGAMLPNKLNIEGEQFATLADDFLRSNNFGDIVVVGGGNTAMDCARHNLRGGGTTTVAYRRTRQDMPAFDGEVQSAQEEGAKFLFNLAPISVQKQGDKLLVQCAHTMSEGRGKLVLTQQRTTLCCQQLVVASGVKYDSSVFEAQWCLQVDENCCVEGNLYAGGDATGHSLVSQAVGDANRAFCAVLQRFGTN